MAGRVPVRKIVSLAQTVKRARLKTVSIVNFVVFKLSSMFFVGAYSHVLRTGMREHEYFGVRNANGRRVTPLF